MLNHDEVAVKRVDLGDDLGYGIKTCMSEYGYGYHYLAVVEYNDGDGYAIIASEPVKLGETERDMINGYYKGEHNVSRMLDAGGNKLVLRD